MIAPPVTPTFRATRQFRGPPWLTTEGESGLLGYALDSIKDAQAERARRALLIRFPQQDQFGTPAPDDALTAIGRDRRIVRGISESATSYAARLLLWLDSWAVAGSPYGLMNQLAAYLGPLPDMRTIDVRGNWYSRFANGTTQVTLNAANWDWDASATALQRWSRFWVIIYPNGLWNVGPNWGDAGFVWGTPGQTWGSTATFNQVQMVRSIISDWKPAGTKCMNIILAFDGSTFNPTTLRDATGVPDGTWGRWGKIVNGQRVPSRLSTARYWDGV